MKPLFYKYFVFKHFNIELSLYPAFAVGFISMSYNIEFWLGPLLVCVW